MKYNQEAQELSILDINKMLSEENANSTLFIFNFKIPMSPETYNLLKRKELFFLMDGQYTSLGYLFDPTGLVMSNLIKTLVEQYSDALHIHLHSAFRLAHNKSLSLVIKDINLEEYNKLCLLQPNMNAEYHSDTVTSQEMDLIEKFLNRRLITLN